MQPPTPMMDWGAAFSLSGEAREAAARTVRALSRSLTQPRQEGMASLRPRATLATAGAVHGGASSSAAGGPFRRRRSNGRKPRPADVADAMPSDGADGRSLPCGGRKGKESGAEPQEKLAAAAALQLCRRLTPAFYLCDALVLAPLLLGKLIRRDEVVLQITEVEAYRPNDTACHGRFGVTARTAPVFGPGGHAYVYLCYGLHTMLNIVADREGVGAAVLIRSCAPVSGLQTIQQRRGQVSEKPVLLTGPGKVGQALGLTTEWSNHPLYEPGGLEILDGPSPENILIGPRVGIDYANAEDVAAPWRFAIAQSPWISPPRHTLRPA